MVNTDITPPHVPWHYHLVCDTLMGSCGVLWTVTYILMYLRSSADRTYSMPLFALSTNVAWEIVHGFYISEDLFEGGIFMVWLTIDVGLVYTLLTHGRREWSHTPIVSQNLGKIFLGLMIWCTLCFWAFAKWWLDEDINLKPGKVYAGREGPDTTELGFWTALFAQINLSAWLLVQLIVRGHSRGTSYGIWGCRALGTVLAQHLGYGYCWWVWPEAFWYVVNPLALVLMGSVLVLDGIYPIVLWWVQKGEVVMADGTRVGKRGDVVKKMG